MAKRIFQAAGYTATATRTARCSTHNLPIRSSRGRLQPRKSTFWRSWLAGWLRRPLSRPCSLARVGLTGSTSLVLVAASAAGGATDGPEDASTAALLSPPLTYVSTSTGTTGPARSSAVADGRLNLAINAFGGIIRWNAAPTQQWNMIGNATPGGETILSANTAGAGGSALLTSHIIYEPY